MNNYYEQIRQACQQNCPRLYEGESKGRDHIYRKKYSSDLHLEDILLAMGMGYSITCGGLFFAAIPGNGYDRFDKLQITNIRYDLSKSPQDQSEEVLKFICDNIK